MLELSVVTTQLYLQYSYRSQKTTLCHKRERGPELEVDHVFWCSEETYGFTGN